MPAAVHAERTVTAVERQDALAFYQQLISHLEPVDMSSRRGSLGAPRHAVRSGSALPARRSLSALARDGARSAPQAGDPDRVSRSAGPTPCTRRPPWVASDPVGFYRHLSCD